MNVEYPLHFDGRGRTATASDAKHIRDLVEQLLLTQLGERVNHPDFGSGLHQLVFAPSSPELAAALEFTLQAMLQKFLGDLIELKALNVDSTEGHLTVELTYLVRETNEVRIDTIARTVAT